MILSKGHQQFAKFIQLMKLTDVDNAVRLMDDPHPEAGTVTVLGLVSRDGWRQAQLWYTAEECKIVWNDEELACHEQPLDDIPLVAARLVSYFEGFTSELTFTVKE